MGLLAEAPLQSPQHPGSVPPLLMKRFARRPQELRLGVRLLRPEPQHHRLCGLGQTPLRPHASVYPYAQWGGNNGPYARGAGQSTPMPPKPSALPLARARPTASQWPPGLTGWSSPTHATTVRASSPQPPWPPGLSSRSPLLCPTASGPAPWLFLLPEALVPSDLNHRSGGPQRPQSTCHSCRSAVLLYPTPCPVINTYCLPRPPVGSVRQVLGN